MQESACACKAASTHPRLHVCTQEHVGNALRELHDCTIAGRHSGEQVGREARCRADDSVVERMVRSLASVCVWWRFAVLVYLREGPQALLQNTPDMPILEDATEHL